MDRKVEIAGDKPSSPRNKDAVAEHHAKCLHRVAKKRDRNAFAELFDFYAPRLKSYLAGLRASPTLAEELSQEILLTVWTKAEQFERHKGSVNAWVFTIARNRYIDEIRKSSKPAIDPYDFELTLPEVKNSDDAYEQQELSVRLEQGLADLPAEQALVVRMCFLEGKSHSEISQILNIPLGTVKSRSRLAFARLRSALEDLYEDESV